MRYDHLRRLQVSFLPASISAETCIVVYDLERETVDDLTLYAHSLLKTAMLDEKTVLQALYDVRVAKEYFLKKSKKFEMRNDLPCQVFDANVISDDTLERFRDWRLEKTRNNTKQKSMQTAQRTVNANLRAVYSWLWWLKDTGRADTFLIGAFPCRVKSEKRRETSDDQPYGFRRSGWIRAKHSAPLCYRRVGANSRHKVPGFVPNEDTRIELLAHFASASGDGSFLAERNKLYLNIINYIGLRRESVNSLRVDQFKRTAIEAVANRGEEYFSVKPNKQKNDREKWYEFPVWLAFQVSDFIQNLRNKEVLERSWSEKLTGGAIFISAHTGRPLRDRSITALFSRAMRSLGAPQRSAVHSWRHKFVGEAINDEIDYRLDRGLDTSADSIKDAVILETGHTHPDSIHAYVVSQVSKGKRKKQKLNPR